MVDEFIVGHKYRFVGNRLHPRNYYGATSNTLFTCVASGERYVVLYWDARVCGKKETTIVAEHGTNNWTLVDR
jgi:hypothetical protein